jgi:hypothetical protein
MNRFVFPAAFLAVAAVIAVVFVSNISVHNSAVISPGDLSGGTMACPALAPGVAFEGIRIANSTGFKLYNISSFEDYVIAPGSSGTITMNVTRFISGGRVTNLTSSSPFNATNSGFGFYSADTPAIPTDGYTVFTEYANITNITAEYNPNRAGIVNGTSSVYNGSNSSVNNTKGGFETIISLPPLTVVPARMNFSGELTNVSSFLEWEYPSYNISVSGVSNDSGILNVTFEVRLPPYYLHPGITQSANPKWKVFNLNQSGPVSSTFYIAPDATPGTYWIYPEISGELSCPPPLYAHPILLTIGSTPYSGPAIFIPLPA